MKIKAWHSGMSSEEAKDLAYWERNVLALHFADASKGDGWYSDDVDKDVHLRSADGTVSESTIRVKAPRYEGWRRVLSLQNGSITFHIPDDFDVGDLPMIERNWDGHSTEEKWARILTARGVGVEP